MTPLQKTLVAILVAVLIVVAWGTRFSYITADGDRLRVNRYTGTTELFSGGVWHDLDQ